MRSLEQRSYNEEEYKIIEYNKKKNRKTDTFGPIMIEKII